MPVSTLRTPMEWEDEERRKQLGLAPSVSMYNRGNFGPSIDATLFFHSCATEISNNGGGEFVVPRGEYHLKSNLTIPNDVFMRVHRGATLHIGTGVTLTVNENILADEYTIFNITGTGTVTFSDRVQHIYAQWFGFVRDADSTTPFKAAIASVPAAGATIELPHGTFWINDAADLKPRTKLIGKGIGMVDRDTSTLYHGGTILKAATATGGYIALGNGMIDTNPNRADDFLIQDIAFDVHGDPADSDQIRCIRLYSFFRGHVDRCAFFNSEADNLQDLGDTIIGITARSYDGLWITNCYFDGTQAKLGGGDSNSRRLHVSNCQFYRAPQMGISIVVKPGANTTTVVEQITITNCIFRDIDDIGIYLGWDAGSGAPASGADANMEQITISNNVFYNVGGSVVGAENEAAVFYRLVNSLNRGITIVGNSVRGENSTKPDDAFRVVSIGADPTWSSLQGLVIANNSIDRVQYGVRIENSVRPVVQGNTMYDVTRGNIIEDTTGFVFSNNIVEDIEGGTGGDAHAGLELHNAQRGIVSGNIFDGKGNTNTAGSHGIWLNTSSQDIKIEGNIIRDFDGNGIFLDAADGGTVKAYIANNLIEDSGGATMEIGVQRDTSNGGTAENYVWNNDFRGIVTSQFGATGGGTQRGTWRGNFAHDFTTTPAIRETFRYYGETTWNPSLINDGDNTSTTVTVTGAAVDDFAIAFYAGSVLPDGAFLSARVSAANTVTVVLHNESGSATDPGSFTVGAYVFRYEASA